MFTLLRSVGVSNFNIHHLQELVAARPNVVPVGECSLSVSIALLLSIHPPVNQIELSPFCTREQLVAYCQVNNIVIQAYSPLTKGQRLSSLPLVSMAKRLACCSLS